MTRYIIVDSDNVAKRFRSCILTFNDLKDAKNWIERNGENGLKVSVVPTYEHVNKKIIF
jgi:hypothetical protein